MKEIDATQPDQKMLIFTESKDTLEYLVKSIQEWGYSVNTIHGAMSSKDRKMQSQYSVTRLASWWPQRLQERE